MATAVKVVNAAKTVDSSILPPRLINFFARYPPRLYSVHFTNNRILTKQEKIALRGNKKTGEAPMIQEMQTPLIPEVQTTSITDETIETSEIADVAPLLDPRTGEPIFEAADQPPSPFQPYKNPATGKWRGPTVSLRRQAELFKLARVYGVETLLPASIKSTEYKEARLLERGTDGPALRGTGPGQRVKGHKWERKMAPMLQKRIEAMEKMPELIREWRQRGNGHQWKKWPKKGGVTI